MAFRNSGMEKHANKGLTSIVDKITVSFGVWQMEHKHIQDKA